MDMKKIIDEKPQGEVYGRNLFAINFISRDSLIGRNVLDVGCGFGWFEKEALKKKVKRIVGIDVSNEAIDFAHKVFRDKRAQFLEGSATKLPFKECSFDILVAWEVIEHILAGEEIRFFREAYRVLRKSGYFYLSAPNKSLFAKLLDPAYLLCSHRHYEAEDLIKMAEDAGFKEVEIDIRGGWAELFGGINLLVAKWIFRRSPFLERMIASWQNKEYLKPGFTAIFLKLKKV